MRISGGMMGGSAGSMAPGMKSDPVSKSIQEQITNAQKRLQELAANESMPPEEKMKKRQEIQMEITSLNQQLREHQAEQRKSQLEKSGPKDKMSVAGGNKAAAETGSAGLSQASMQTLLSAETSMKQASVQGGMAKQMEGRTRVLEMELKQDGGRGAVEKKMAELSGLRQKIRTAGNSQMSALTKANQTLEEAGNTKPDWETDKTDANRPNKAEDKPAEAADAAQAKIEEEAGNTKERVSVSVYA